MQKQMITDGIVNGRKKCSTCEKVKDAVTEFYSSYNDVLERVYTFAQCRACKLDAVSKYNQSTPGYTKSRGNAKEILITFLRAFDNRDGKNLKRAAEEARVFLMDKRSPRVTKED
jgi:hypothetical protein